MYWHARARLATVEAGVRRDVRRERLSSTLAALSAGVLVTLAYFHVVPGFQKLILAGTMIACGLIFTHGGRLWVARGQEEIVREWREALETEDVGITRWVNHIRLPDGGVIYRDAETQRAAELPAPRAARPAPAMAGCQATLRGHGRTRETHGLVTGRPGLPYQTTASIHGGTAYIAQT
ncbi:hypothetical protein GCM10023321_14330 [Pseudonocardia eucalypti]|uniref:Uncharacterized protein n=1 Tax=Pseudonocardia eucalypti TaxID=648755 RepID=A0ABP9PSB4_9PSEU|nr:hypothetical protein [Pseudonocardia eucalypti]